MKSYFHFIPRPAFLLAIFLTLLVPSLAHAATLTVALDGSAQYRTIQDAVNAAGSGDTVLVAAGTYSGPSNRDIDFGGKSLTVMSQAGAGSTTIDCGGYKSTDGSGNHRGFYIHSGEANATISGFTVKNGYETLVSNIPDSGNGGGIFNSGSIATIVANCTITGNTADGYGGGGIYNYRCGTTTLTNCAIIGNTAYSNRGVGGNGGGIQNISGTAMLTNCTIIGNIASSKPSGPSGLRNRGRHTSSSNGGTNTRAPVGDTLHGGGIYNTGGGMITLTNCAIIGNTASSGGGLSGFNDMTTLTNCTVTRNTAFNGGGIFYVNNSGITTLTNDIIYGDTGGEINVYGTSAPVISFSDIQGGQIGTSNINADPQFVNAAAGDLHITPGSPCLGKGTPTGAPATDKDGNTRPNPPSMGAYDTNASANPLLPPVLLVHGTFSNAQTWDGGMSQRLAKEGFIVDTVNFPTEPETLSNEASIESQAAAIGRRVQELEDRTGQRHICMVCHSMGGLAARYYLEHLGLWPVHLDQSRQAGVDKLILLGTPNWGFDAPFLDPVSTVTQAHLATQPLAADGYDSSAVDTYDNWSTAIKEMFAEWEPAPNSLGNGQYGYPYGHNLTSWLTGGGHGYQTPIQAASYAFADALRIKFAVHPFGSDFNAVNNVIGMFAGTIFNDADKVSLDFYTQKAQQWGVMYPDNAKTAGVDGRLVSPFLKALNTTPDNSGAHIYLVGGTSPAALQFETLGQTLTVLGPYNDSILPNDGIVPTDSALGQDPITGVYLYPHATKAVIGVAHTSMTSDPTVIDLVVKWLEDAPVISNPHVLWVKPDGTFALWTISGSGSYTSTPAYGPYSGWSARAIADGSDGRTRILLQHAPEGAAAVWTVDSATGAFTSTPAYGPYGGWTGTALAVGHDNLTRLQWRHSPDGQSSVWTVAGSGSITSTPGFGPYGTWTASSLAVGGDSLSRLLWGDGAGHFSFWTLDALSNISSTPSFGPIPGWSPSILASGPDANAHLMLNRSDGAMALWAVNGAGTLSSSPLYGPIPGWAAHGMAVGSDGLPRVLWSRSDGMSAVWTVAGDGSITSTPGYGPIPGWTATAVAAP